jgi:hypothetical protein
MGSRRLRPMTAAHDDGQLLGGQTDTVGEAVESWLTRPHGAPGVNRWSIDQPRSYARNSGAGNTEARAAMGRRG